MAPANHKPVCTEVGDTAETLGLVTGVGDTATSVGGTLVTVGDGETVGVGEIALVTGGGDAGLGGASTEVPVTVGPAVDTVWAEPFVGVMVAVFGKVVPVAALDEVSTVTDSSRLAPGANVPMLQVTVEPLAVQPPVHETKETFGPSVSVTVTPSHGTPLELSTWMK